MTTTAATTTARETDTGGASADQPSSAAPGLEYTPHRYIALRWAAQSLIVLAPGGLPKRGDGHDLDPDVFAALVALHDAGHLRPQQPPPGRTTTLPRLVLTLPGAGLLDRYRLEHGRRHRDAPNSRS